MAEKQKENGQSINPPSDTLVGTLQGGFKKLYAPVFWVAIGYAVCKYMDRKKVN